MEVVAITCAAATTLELMLDVVADVVLFTSTLPTELKLMFDVEEAVDAELCTDDFEVKSTLAVEL